MSSLMSQLKSLKTVNQQHLVCDAHSHRNAPTLDFSNKNKMAAAMGGVNKNLARVFYHVTKNRHTGMFIAANGVEM